MTLQYQEQTSSQTLASGLKEYHDKHPQLVKSPDLSPEIGPLFQHHDVIHVVFGCDTSLHDETLADTWTILGSTISLKAYINYLQYPEATALLKEIGEEMGYLKLLGDFIKTIPDIIRVFWRTRRMAKKWPWQNYQAYLNTPLADIRQEFGIQVV